MIKVWITYTDGTVSYMLTYSVEATTRLAARIGATVRVGE